MDITIDGGIYNMDTYETGHYDNGHARITCMPYD
jgi:hypothetical protein